VADLAEAFADNVNVVVEEQPIVPLRDLEQSIIKDYGMEIGIGFWISKNITEKSSYQV
jgi:hypothetical protein